MMKWISNGFKEININNTIANINEPMHETIQRIKDWQSQFIVGLPKSINDKYTIEELQNMGIVGLYRKNKQ